MKKKVLLLLAAVLSLSAQAQRFEEVQKSSGEYVVPIPGIFTCDGKARAAVGVKTSMDDFLYKSYKIIDENLKEEATIKVENDVKPYALVKARTCEFKGEFRADESRYYEGNVFDVGIENFDVKAFSSWVYEENVPPFAIVKETTRTSTSVTFEIIFDESVAKKYMVDNQTDSIEYLRGTFVISAYKSVSKISSCKISIYTYKRVYNGDWKETKDYFKGNRESLIPLSYLDMNTAYDTDYLYVTQSLFNSDKAYEYIQPIYELYKGSSYDYDRDNDGEVDSMRVEYSLSAVGFSIVQEDGNIISSVKFGDGWSDALYDGFGLLSYLRFDNKNYIVADVWRKNDDGKSETASIFYAFTPGNPSSIKAVRTENHGIKATPAIARQSEVVSVDVSSFSNPRHIMVVNSNGQTMMQQAVAEGANSVKVKTAGLPAGLYVVKVSDGKSTSDNCKIIIR